MASDAPLTLKAARAVLGISPLASGQELRRAFREAAKAAHPDRTGGDGEPFRQVVEAYRRLQGLPDSTERIIQPPARREAGPEILVLTPLVAAQGGAAEHRLADGRRLRLTLPAGLRNGDSVRAAGVLLTVVLRGAPEMMVRGDDLWLSVAVSPRTLAEGGRVAVETPLGRRIVWVTRKASERGLVRLSGQGLPARGPHRQGDLFLRLGASSGQADSAARTLLRQFTAAWAA